MVTASQQKQGGWHRLFELGVILKGLNGLIELVFGFLLLFFNVGALVQTLINNELVEDPTDFVANHLHRFMLGLSPGAELYSALYLLSHGIIKLILVWGLLRDKLWAYPASFAILGLFVTYQVITYVRTHSLPLLILTVFDLIIIGLIWQEYRSRHGEHAKG